MGPGNSLSDAIDGALADAKACGESPRRLLPWPTGENRFDNRFCESGTSAGFSAWVQFWMQRHSTTATALKISIFDVLELRSKEEMGWITAQWGVAPMKNAQIPGDGPERDQPCETMGADVAISGPNGTVVVPGAGTGPEPVIMAFILGDTHPESVDALCLRESWWRHGEHYTMARGSA